MYTSRNNIGSSIVFGKKLSYYATEQLQWALHSYDAINPWCHGMSYKCSLPVSCVDMVKFEATHDNGPQQTALAFTVK